jgi:signal transduction histidine kinase
MSLRRLFVLVLVTFAVAVAAAEGYLAWRSASKAMEAELDKRAEWVAGAAAETGLQSSLVVGLVPGMETTLGWRGLHARLMRLRRYVSEAYILTPDNRAVVTSDPGDTVGVIGSPLPQFDLYAEDLARARTVGEAATPAFVGEDGTLYKWGFKMLGQSPFILAVRMRADYLAPLASLRRNLFLGSAVAAVIAALLAALLAAAVIEPVERLSRVALRIQHGYIERPVAEERGDELGRLSLAMENMRQSILERDERLRVMLAQVAHEIRNPLGGLELFASAAAETDDPAERRRLMGRVRSEVSALNTIIDDFLTFARPVPPQREPTDLREPLEEAAALVRAELEKRGGTLEVRLPETPLMATVAGEHAKRATLNLLRNAAQVAEHVRLEGSLAQGEVVISVSDDGPGVPPELRQQIFEPFVTDKEQGAGLGLSIVRRLAEAHGGRVELTRTGETNGGSGSEFRIYFESASPTSHAAHAE